MRFTLRLSPSLTSAGDPRFRLRFLLFDVRMCRRCDRPRFTFPVPVTLKRLAAPLCVFNFGIKSSENSRQLSAIGCQFHFILAECQMTAQARLVFPLFYSCHSDPEQSRRGGICFGPTTRAWLPAPEEHSRWAHSAPQPCDFLPSASLSLVPSPSSSAPESRAACCPLGGDGTPRCCAAPRP